MENQSKTEPDTVLRLIVAAGHTDAVHRDCKSVKVTMPPGHPGSKAESESSFNLNQQVAAAPP